MIDFRYHLVSLVAVFIALAVGIALGAGPLREGISSTLESEVADLRAERADLRAQVDSARRQAEAKEEGLQLVAAGALDGTLQDVRVGVVVMPGADRNALDALEGQLTTAGADVAMYAELASRWDDPKAGKDRQQLLSDLAPSLTIPGLDEGEEPTVQQVLAAVLSGRDAEGHFGAWLSATGELEKDGIVDVTWRDGTPAGVTDRRAPEVLVVMSGGLTVTAATETAGAQTLTGRLDLVRALADAEEPVVVAGPGGESVVPDLADRIDPLVRAVREDSALTKEISTVDNLESVAGQLAASFATSWELQGESGHYGLGELAESAFPALPPSSTGVEILPGSEGGTDGQVDGQQGQVDGQVDGQGEGQGQDDAQQGVPGDADPAVTTAP